MLKRGLFLILAIALSLTSIGQKNTKKCNCKYPFKPLCWDYCTKILFQKKNFKQTVDRKKLSDSGRIKLNDWIYDSLNNQSLQSILDKKDFTKVDAALEAYYDNPDNIEVSPFMHSVGATVSILFGKIYYPLFDPTFPRSFSSYSLMQTNFTYFPRYNITQGENSSFSVGVPVGIGIGIAQNSNGSDAGTLFAYDLPVVLDYNFGCKSTGKSERTFGGYVGAGFGYYHVSITQSAYSDYSGTSYGPLGRLGIRFSYQDWGNKAVTVGTFYKKGLEKAKLTTIGINVLYDF